MINNKIVLNTKHPSFVMQLSLPNGHTGVAWHRTLTIDCHCIRLYPVKIELKRTTLVYSVINGF